MMVHRCLAIAMMALVGALLGRPAHAQSAEASRAAPYFHEAAQQYVASDLQRALATVNEGLRVAPDDARLLALREKIRQQQRQSGSGSGGQQPSPQRGQNAPNNASQNEGDSQGAERTEGTQPPPDPQPGEAGGQAGSDGSESGDTPPRPASEGAGAERGAMDARAESGLSRAQAARILRALEAQEKQLLRQVLQRDRRPQRILKEW